MSSHEIFDLVADLLTETNDEIDASLLAQVLRQVRMFNVPWILPVDVLLEQIERQHAPSEGLSGRIVAERPVKRFVVVFKARDAQS